MKKSILVAAMLCVVMSLSACFNSNTDSNPETENPESVFDQTTAEATDTAEDNTLTGTQTYSNDYISFEYDADLMSVLENGDGLDYTIAVVQNNAKSIVPHVDMIGLDTSDIGNQLTAEQFESLSKEAVAQYYGVATSDLNITITGTEINESDPENSSASTILTIEATEDTPKIYAESKLLYNTTDGVMCVALLDDDLESEEMVPYLKVLESIQLK